MQVAERYLGFPYDIAVSSADLAKVPPAWRAWARCSEIPTLVQLNHAGLQSTRGSGRYVWEPSIAPSSMRVSTGRSFVAQLLGWLLFHQARGMSKEDIKEVVQQFKEAAILVHESGFQGFVHIQLILSWRLELQQQG